MRLPEQQLHLAQPAKGVTCHIRPLGCADELRVHHKLWCSGVQAGAGVQEDVAWPAAGLVAHGTLAMPACLLTLHLLPCLHPSCHLSHDSLRHVHAATHCFIDG